jgi:hypothetical protein
MFERILLMIISAMPERMHQGEPKDVMVDMFDHDVPLPIRDVKNEDTEEHIAGTENDTNLPPNKKRGKHLSCYTEHPLI